MQINQSFILNENGDVEYPDVFLCKRNHSKIGIINNVKNLKIIINEKSADEISFDVYKHIDELKCFVWDDLIDLKCVYVKGFGYFEIAISTIDGNETIKTITGISQSISELSQINAILEVNSETDITLHDGNLTKFYDLLNTGYSLIHRILNYAPHYTIGHVDTTLYNITKEFSFNSDIMSIFDELSIEVECLFIIDSENRIINVYDLKDTCNDCGCRKIKNNICTNCNSENIRHYGNDTQIFISSKNLADSITLEGDKDSVKNCLKIKSADELMDAAIAQINPNGTNKIYKFTASQMKDMSDELVVKLREYENVYNAYREEYENLYNKILNSEQAITNYKYNMSPTIELISKSTCDEMMQSVLDKYNNSKIAVLNYSSISKTTAQNNIKRRIKQMLESGFELILGDYTFDKYNCVYSGTITIKDTVNSTETDVVSSTHDIVVNIVDADSDSEYQTYINQEIEDIFKKVKINKIDIIIEHLDEWSNSMLSNYSQAIENCISVLQETGCGVKPNDEDSIQLEKYQLYSIWLKYKEQIDNRIIELETLIQEETENKKIFETRRNDIHQTLNIENFLGETLYKELYSYIREDTYENSNFSSDFDNDELKSDKIIEHAKELYELAEEELDKASNINYSLTASLRNLLVMEEFKSIANKVKIGNYIRAEVDEEIKKLRLISIEFDFENLDTISVTFSNATKPNDETSVIESILEQSSSIATSFDSVKRKSEKGHDIYNNFQKIKNEGLNAALFNIKNADEENFIIAEDGVTMKRGNEESGYDDRQLKIVHNMIAMTDDSWNSVRLALGQGTYNNQICYGIWGDVIVGNILAGEKLLISNDKSTFTVDGNEVRITDGSLYIENGDTYTKIDNRDENIVEIGKIQDEDVKVTSKFELLANGVINYNETQANLYSYNPSGGYYTEVNVNYERFYNLICSCDKYVFHSNGKNLYRLDTSKLNSEFVLVKRFSDIVISFLIQSDRDDVIYFGANEKTENLNYNVNIYEYNISDDTYNLLCYYNSETDVHSGERFFIKNNIFYTYYSTASASIGSGLKYTLKSGSILNSDISDSTYEVTFTSTMTNMVVLSKVITYNGVNYCVASASGDKTIWLCKIDLSTGNCEMIKDLITYTGSNTAYDYNIHCFILDNKFHLVFDFNSYFSPTTHCIYDFKIKESDIIYDAPVLQGETPYYAMQLCCTVNDKVHFFLKTGENLNGTSHCVYYTNDDVEIVSNFESQTTGLGFKSSRQNSYCKVGDVIYHTNGNDYSNEVYKLNTSKTDAEWELAYILDGYTIYHMIQGDNTELVYQIAKNIANDDYELIAYNLTDNTLNKIISLETDSSYGFVKNGCLYYYRTRLMKTNLTTDEITYGKYYSNDISAGDYYCLSHGIEVDGYIYALMYLNETNYVHLCKISITDGDYTSIFKYYYPYIQSSGYSLFLYKNKINIITYMDYYTNTPHINTKRFVCDIKKNIVYQKNDMFEYYGYDDVDKTSSYYTAWLPAITTSNAVHFFLGQTTFNENGENGGYEHIIYTEDSVEHVEDLEDNKIFYISNEGNGFFNGSITTYNGYSSVVINKNKNKIIDINTPQGNVFYVDEYGNLNIQATLNASYILGGTINIGDGSFAVDKNGAVKITKGDFNINDKFKVTNDGDMYGISGILGGWEIGENYIKSKDFSKIGITNGILLDSNGEIRSKGSWYSSEDIEGWFARLCSGKWIFGYYDSKNDDPFVPPAETPYSDISVNGIYMCSKETLINNNSQYLFAVDTTKDSVKITNSSNVSPALEIINNGSGNTLFLSNVEASYENALLRGRVVCDLNKDGIYEKRNGYVSIFGEAYNGRIVLRADVGTNSGEGNEAIEHSACGTYNFPWGVGSFKTLYSITQETLSDRKEKDVIGTLNQQKSLEFINGLIPTSFTFKSSINKRIHMGFIAQDVHQLIKEFNMGNIAISSAIWLKKGDPTEYYYNENAHEEELKWSLKYEEFIAPLVSSVQLLSKKIDELETTIRELEKINNI